MNDKPALKDETRLSLTHEPTPQHPHRAVVRSGPIESRFISTETATKALVSGLGPTTKIAAAYYLGWVQARKETAFESLRTMDEGHV